MDTEMVSIGIMCIPKHNTRCCPETLLSLRCELKITSFLYGYHFAQFAQLVTDSTQLTLTIDLERNAMKTRNAMFYAVSIHDISVTHFNEEYLDTKKQRIVYSV